MVPTQRPVVSYTLTENVPRDPLSSMHERPFPYLEQWEDEA